MGAFVIRPQHTQTLYDIKIIKVLLSNRLMVLLL